MTSPSEVTRMVDQLLEKADREGISRLEILQALRKEANTTRKPLKEVLERVFESLKIHRN